MAWPTPNKPDMIDAFELEVLAEVGAEHCSSTYNELLQGLRNFCVKEGVKIFESTAYIKHPLDTARLASRTI